MFLHRCWARVTCRLQNAVEAVKLQQRLHVSLKRPIVGLVTVSVSVLLHLPHWAYPRSCYVGKATAELSERGHDEKGSMLSAPQCTAVACCLSF